MIVYILGFEASHCFCSQQTAENVPWNKTACSVGL